MIYLILSIVSLVLCVVSGFLIVVGNGVLVNKTWEKGDGFWSEQLATNLRNTSIVLLIVFIVLANFSYLLSSFFTLSSCSFMAEMDSVTTFAMEDILVISDGMINLVALPSATLDNVS